MIKTDTGLKRHIARKKPYVIMDTSAGPVPLFKTLCGLEAMISIVDEPNPTCKHCIKIRGNANEEV